MDSLSLVTEEGETVTSLTKYPNEGEEVIVTFQFLEPPAMKFKYVDEVNTFVAQIKHWYEDGCKNMSLLRHSKEIDAAVANYEQGIG